MNLLAFEAQGPGARALLRLCDPPVVPLSSAVKVEGGSADKQRQTVDWARTLLLREAWEPCVKLAYEACLRSGSKRAARSLKNMLKGDVAQQLAGIQVEEGLGGQLCC